MVELFYVKRGEKISGPFGLEQLQKLLAQKKLKSNDLVGASEDGEWTRLSEVYKDIASGSFSLVSAFDGATPIAGETSGHAFAEETTPRNLVLCADCRGQISIRATTCPHCGTPVAGTQDISPPHSTNKTNTGVPSSTDANESGNTNNNGQGAADECRFSWNPDTLMLTLNIPLNTVSVHLRDIDSVSWSQIGTQGQWILDMQSKLGERVKGISVGIAVMSIIVLLSGQPIGILCLIPAIACWFYREAISVKLKAPAFNMHLRVRTRSGAEYVVGGTDRDVQHITQLLNNEIDSRRENQQKEVKGSHEDHVASNSAERRCVRCKEAIHADAAVCPHCRVWQDSSQYASNFIVMWIVLMVLCLVFVWIMTAIINHAIMSSV